MSDWGQGSVNNDIGWGQGAARNSIGWGEVHYSSFGHTRTNLTGLGEVVIAFMERVINDSGIVESPYCVEKALKRFTTI